MLLEHGVVLPFALKSGLYIGTALYNWEGWNNEIDLPLYALTPQAIFTNQIPLFDVNFFNPDERRTKFDWVKKVDYVEIGQEALAQNVTANGKYKETAVDSQLKDKIKNEGKTPSNASDYWKVAAGNGNAVMPAGATTKVYTDNGTTYIYKSWTDQTGIHEVILVENDSNDNNEGSIKDGVHSLSYDLSGIVSKWYYTLRTFAIVGMMTVLVYIGIRIVLSSTSSQKSKYKQLLGDWFIGMVLLFTLHFIMVFSNIFADNLTATLTRYNPSIHVPFVEDKLGVIKDKLKEYNIKTTTDASAAKNNPQLVYIHKEDGKSYIEWHTDLMGHIRLKVRENQGKDEIYVGYTIMFLVIVFYVTFFIFTYLKRVILMAFLTIISPLVALTYPIDKANDGQAQGFNFWFKEYIFNLLLQPMHLLIYTILVSSAIDLATRNWIYSLVALGFIASAEKLVRQMFNFSKASTPGVFAGPAGAAMVMSGMRWLFGHGPRGPQGGPGRGALGNGAGNSEDNAITASGEGPNSQERVSNFLARSNENNRDSRTTVTQNFNNNDDYTDDYLTAFNSRPYSNDEWNNVLEEGYEGGDGYEPLTGSDSSDLIDEQPDIRMQDNFEGLADDYNYDGDYDDYYYDAMNSTPYTDAETEDIMESGYIDNNDYVEDAERLAMYGADASSIGASGGDLGSDVGGGSSDYDTIGNESASLTRTGNDPSINEEGTLEGEESTAPIIQDRSAMPVDNALEGTTNRGNSSERISEQDANFDSGELPSSAPVQTFGTNLQTPTTAADASSRNSNQQRMSAREYIEKRERENQEKMKRKQQKMSAREYIESRESAEAITNRRQNELRNNEEERKKNKELNKELRDKSKEYKKERKKAVRNEVIDKYKDNLKRRVGESMQNGEPVRKISRAVGGAMGLAAAGTVGLAAGIASGDGKNVTTYTAAGIAGGAKLGSSLAEVNQKRVSEATKDLTDTYKKASMSNEEYKKEKALENQMKAAFDEKNIEYAQRKLGKSRSETKKQLKEIFPIYMNADIKDIKDMLILEKMADPDGKNTHGRKYSRDAAIAAYKVLKKSGVDNNDRNKALDRIKSDWGVNKNEAERLYTAAKDLDRLYS